MYKIIGADQKEYGPITAEQLRRWVVEGRVNAQTRARLESGGEWRPLGEFPEFADLLGAPPVGASGPVPPGAFSPAGTSGSSEAALDRVRAPAIGLIVTAAINVLFGIWALIASGGPTDLSALEGISDPEMQRVFREIIETAEGPVGIGSKIVNLLVSGLILAGGMRMLKLRSHGLAMAASILSLIPCITPCCGLITFPFGIWALIVLSKPEVKSHFG